MEEIEISTVSRPIQKTAVTVRNAYKRYTPHDVIFNGLDLTVYEGTIYGLLGPSGCGKTTLLNCISGRSQLDSGSIELNVTKRSEIGFMPQIVSLYFQLTIFENFYVYGFLFGIPRNVIKSRGASLISFLDLPSGDSVVTNLSGGQQRRVSLAVTFIHEPQIFILDEPTVGLDPILSHAIWERFVQMAAKGKTIIITTHYVDEAKQANSIGVMRNGVLLAEEEPLKLIDKYGCSDLEEVFLLLSQQQEAALTNAEVTYPKNTQSVLVKYEDDKRTVSLTKINALVFKNYKIVRREYLFIFLVLLLPFTQVYLSNITLGIKPKNLHLAVINEEIPIGQCYDAVHRDGCFLQDPNVTLSCKYLSYLWKESYILDEFHDVSIAKEIVRGKQARALLHFPKNYTESLAQRVTDGIRTSDEIVRSGVMDFWIDKSDYYIAACIQFDIVRFVQPFLTQALTSCGMHPESVMTLPLKYEEPIYGSVSEGFATQTAAAMLCLICFFLPTMLTGGFMLIEKIEGIIERLHIVGVKALEIIISIALLQMIIYFIQAAESAFVTYVLFDNPMKGSVFLLGWLLMSVGFTGMSFGLMLATVNSNLSITVYAGIGANIALAFVTGISWPLEGAHYYLRSINWAIPMTLPIQAARAIGSKSFQLSSPAVLAGFASNIAWSSIFLGISYLFMKFKKDVWIVKR